MSEPWFRPKRYGIGLSPTRKGWILIVALIALTIVLRLSRLPNGWTTIIVCFASAALVAFAVAKSKGQWRWRWGDKD